MVRLGIAGIGTIAKDYIGLIAGGQVGGVKLTALCSRNRESARQMDERYGLNSRIFQDYGEMLLSGLVDGVLICTPHGQGAPGGRGRDPCAGGETGRDPGGRGRCGAEGAGTEAGAGVRRPL